MLGVLDESVVRARVGPVWCATEYPDLEAPWAEWRELFDVAGYTKDGEPSDRPTQPIQLYRAAPWGRQYGHSWTEDPEVARSFLTSRARHRFSPVLWTARVKPERLLARLEEHRSGEPSYVVETKRRRCPSVPPA